MIKSNMVDKRRPPLRPGDIVKFSKKGKQADYPWPDNTTMIVTRTNRLISSRDSYCMLRCRTIINGKPEFIMAYRHHLWFTGQNIVDAKKKTRVMNSND